jgi:hypothetical protein
MNCLPRFRVTLLVCLAIAQFQDHGTANTPQRNGRLQAQVLEEKVGGKSLEGAKGENGLTVPEVKAVAELAKRLWQQSGLNATQRRVLEALEYQVKPLPAGRLAHFGGSTISVASSAGGLKWHVEPMEQSQLLQPLKQAKPGMPPASGYDLLTVLLHEQGNALGLDDTAEPSDVMWAFTQPGTRRLPCRGRAEKALPGRVQSSFNSVYHPLASGPFSQDWSDTSLITTNNDWSNVPSINGYLGDYITSSTPVNVDPRTLINMDNVTLSVIAQGTATGSAGAVYELENGNPTVALHASATADAPFLLLHLNSLGAENVVVSYTLREMDNDNAPNMVDLQYRTGTTGAWTSVPAGFVTFTATSDEVFPIVAALPAALNDQPQIQLRIITTNATGSDTMIGVDDILVTAERGALLSTNDFLDAGQGIPGGGFIYRPIPGVINEAGQVALRATAISGLGAITSENDALLLTDATGTLRVVAQEGSAIPGGGTAGGFFQYPLLTPAGVTVVRERFNAATAANDYAYLVSDDGVTSGLLSREGDTAPAGGVFTGHVAQPSSDDQERVYFNCLLAGVSANRNSGIWVDVGGSLTQLIREGDNVSALVGDAAWLGNVFPTTSAAGDGVAFIAHLQNNPANKLQKTLTAHNQVLIGGAPDSLAVIARRGDVIPGVGRINGFTGVSRSQAGDHAFMSQLAFSTATPVVTKANDQVMLAMLGGTLHVVAQENTTEVIAGSGLLTARFGHFYAAADGSILFQAWIVGPGVVPATDGVICRWSVAGGIEVLAREGDPAPVTGSSYRAFTGFSVSPGGAVALTASLANKRIVLLRALPGDSLAFVTQTTETVTFNGAPRRILSLGIHESGTGPGHGGNGKGAAINDAGEVFTVLSLGAGEYSARVYR